MFRCRQGVELLVFLRRQSRYDCIYCLHSPVRRNVSVPSSSRRELHTIVIEREGASILLESVHAKEQSEVYVRVQSSRIRLRWMVADRKTCCAER